MTAIVEQPYIEADPGLIEALGIGEVVDVTEHWALLASESREHLHLEHRINLRLYLLKAEYSSSAEWERMAWETLRMPRRSLFEAANAARLLCRFPAHRDTLLRCGRSTCETLHKLTDDQFYQVASRWPALHELTREAVRTIVAEKLGKPAATPKADPTDPEQLKLFEPDELDVSREVNLAGAYLRRATSAISYQLQLELIDEIGEANLAHWLDDAIATLGNVRRQLTIETHGDQTDDDQDNEEESPHEALAQITGNGQRRQAFESAAATA